MHTISAKNTKLIHNTEPQTAGCNGNHPRSEDQCTALQHHTVSGTYAQHKVFWGRHPRQPARLKKLK